MIEAFVSVLIGSILMIVLLMGPPALIGLGIGHVIHKLNERKKKREHQNQVEGRR